MPATDATSPPTPAPTSAPTHAPPQRRPLFRFDPGWLFLIAGCAVLVAAVLIPAQDDLAVAQWQRDKARAVERWRAERLASYTAFLNALDAGDPTLVRSLAATQLNLTPAGATPIIATPHGGRADASIFPELEPAFEPVPEPVPPDSTLHAWATDGRARLLLIAAGAMCLLYGLLPPATVSRSRVRLKAIRRAAANARRRALKAQPDGPSPLVLWLDRLWPPGLRRYG